MYFFPTITAYPIPIFPTTLTSMADIKIIQILSSSSSYCLTAICSCNILVNLYASTPHLGKNFFYSHPFFYFHSALHLYLLLDFNILEIISLDFINFDCLDITHKLQTYLYRYSEAISVLQSKNLQR
jgi:hypothetical protein